MKGNKFRILYVGPLIYGGTCSQRMEDLQSLGHGILPVDTLPPEVQRRKKLLIERMITKLWGPRDLAQVNNRVIQLMKRKRPDILWVDKGLTVDPGTIAQAKTLCSGLLAVSYSPDDMMNPNNQSRRYLRCITLYDLHVTTKSYNVTELKGLGTHDVLFINNAYCPSVHRPVEVSQDDRSQLGGKVGFIGTFEEDRARNLLYLAEKGIHVKVWGNWPKKFKNKTNNLEIMEHPLWSDDYAKAICSFDINLCFLRKENRDLQTTRSIEIPACGGFMLAERTDEHMRLFDESGEAEFFGSREELLEKVRYYLVHDEERRCIAAAGRKRCLNSGYSNQVQLEQVLQYIEDRFIHA